MLYRTQSTLYWVSKLFCHALELHIESFSKHGLTLLQERIAMSETPIEEAKESWGDAAA